MGGGVEQMARTGRVRLGPEPREKFVAGDCSAGEQRQKAEQRKTMPLRNRTGEC